MKTAQLSLAALLIAGPLCLAACGDDSGPPNEREDVEGPGGVIIPPDESPAQSLASGLVAVDATGKMTQPTRVATPGSINGSHTELNLAAGTVLRDANNAPVAAGDVDVKLASYNSNRNSGVQAFRDKRSKVGSARQAVFDSFPYPLGGIELMMTAGTQVVTQVSGGQRQLVSVNALTFCSPSLGVFNSISVSQQRLDGTWETFIPAAAVINNCVTIPLPAFLQSALGIPAGFLIAGNVPTGGAG